MLIATFISCDISTPSPVESNTPHRGKNANERTQPVDSALASQRTNWEKRRWDSATTLLIPQYVDEDIYIFYDRCGACFHIYKSAHKTVVIAVMKGMLSKHVAQLYLRWHSAHSGAVVHARPAQSERERENGGRDRQQKLTGERKTEFLWHFWRLHE